jgi:hypothetical protein
MSVVLPCWSAGGACATTVGGSARHGGRADVLGQRTGVEDTGETQRTPEGATPLRQRETSRIGMQMNSPTRQSACGIGLQPKTGAAIDPDNT